MHLGQLILWKTPDNCMVLSKAYPIPPLGGIGWALVYTSKCCYLSTTSLVLTLRTEVDNMLKIVIHSPGGNHNLNKNINAQQRMHKNVMIYTKSKHNI